MFIYLFIIIYYMQDTVLGENFKKANKSLQSALLPSFTLTPVADSYQQEKDS